MVSLEEVYGFGATFVTIGFAMIIIGTLRGMFVFERNSVRAADAIDAGDQAGAKALRGRLAGFGILDTVLLLFTITAMVLRLGA